MHFLLQQPNSSGRPFEPLIGSDNANIVPHTSAKFGPIMGKNDVFIGVSYPAFVPIGNIAAIVPVI